MKRNPAHAGEKPAQENGPVPPGMIVTFKDGDEDNCNAGNLMLITRAEHLRLNKYRYKKMPADLKSSVLALAKLEVKAFSLLRRKNDNQIRLSLL